MTGGGPLGLDPHHAVASLHAGMITEMIAHDRLLVGSTIHTRARRAAIGLRRRESGILHLPGAGLLVQIDTMNLALALIGTPDEYALFEVMV